MGAFVNCFRQFTVEISPKKDEGHKFVQLVGITVGRKRRVNDLKEALRHRIA
jgi:hypothetical protein